MWISRCHKELKSLGAIDTALHFTMAVTNRWDKELRSLGAIGRALYFNRAWVEVTNRLDKASDFSISESWLAEMPKPLF